MKRLREQALKPLFWTGRCVFLGMWVDDGDVKYSSQVITMMSLSTHNATELPSHLRIKVSEYVFMWPLSGAYFILSVACS